MITILKPINEVVGYVMDTKSWTGWGIGLIKAEYVDTNTIEATYLEFSFGGTGPNESVTRWLVARSISTSGEVQTVMFTNPGNTRQTVEYIFTSSKQGASTDVKRIEANSQQEGLGTWLLPQLKKVIEGIPGPNSPIPSP